jgi:hypothetical protein
MQGRHLQAAATPSIVITGLDPVTHSPHRRPKRQGIVPAKDAGRDSGFSLRVRYLSHPPMGPRIKSGDDEVASVMLVPETSTAARR